MTVRSVEFSPVSKKCSGLNWSVLNGRNSPNKKAFRKKREAERFLMKLDKTGYPDGEPEVSKN